MNLELILTLFAAWYSQNVPTSDDQVASHFASQRPILGICLKRYSMTADGIPVRKNTHIDIPLEIGLPHFVSEDLGYDSGPLFVHFKLSLQSIVCHRGKSVDSGHYVALVRDELADIQSSEGPSQESDNRHETWLLFDDLAKKRVQKVDIAQALQDESPYLLFYRVQPTDNYLNDPESLPPYLEESTNNLTESNTAQKIVYRTGGSNSIHRSAETAIQGADASERQLSVKPTREQSSVMSDIASSASEQFTSLRHNNSADSNDHKAEEPTITPSIVTTTPTTPTTNSIVSNEPRHGYFSNSRRNSRVGKIGSRSRASSPGAGDSRLSFTLGRLTTRTSLERITPLGNPSATETSSNTSIAATGRGLQLEHANAGGLGRNRSRKDKMRHRMSMQIERAMNEKLPDRQCSIM